MTILFSDQRHIYISRQSYREAVDVGNKVTSQNNIQHTISGLKSAWCRSGLCLTLLLLLLQVNSKK